MKYTHEQLAGAGAAIIGAQAKYAGARKTGNAARQATGQTQSNKRAAIATYCAMCKVNGDGPALAAARFADFYPDKDIRKGISFAEIYGPSGAGVLNRHEQRDMLAQQWAAGDFRVKVGTALSDIRTGTDYAKALGKAVRGLLDRHLAGPDEVRKMVTATIREWQKTQPVTPVVAENSKLALAV